MKVSAKSGRRSALRVPAPVVFLTGLFFVMVFMSRSSVPLPEELPEETRREEMVAESRSMEMMRPPVSAVDTSYAKREETTASEVKEAEVSADRVSGELKTGEIHTMEMKKEEIAGKETKAEDANAGSEGGEVLNRWEKMQRERELLEADAVIAAEERAEKEQEDGDVTVAGEAGAGTENCLPYIFYDKPIKTGSTAVTYALRSYILSRGGKHRRCSYSVCTPRAEDVCNGTGSFEHLIGHVKGREGLVECMKTRGYYAVTSVRDPLERWRSAFSFNKMMKGTHYGISWEDDFAAFMEKYPDCTLYHYYDQLGLICDKSKVDWQERLRRIVTRYDEVVDLYDENEDKGGMLYQKVRKYIAQANVSKKTREETEDFDRSRLVPEQALYDALRAKRLQKADENRMPC